MPLELPVTTNHSSLPQKLIAEISKFGPLTFSRFMDLALYDPQSGYYMTERKGTEGGLDDGSTRIGWGGDFYTAPEIHPLLAQCLLQQVREVDDLLDHPSPFTVLEMGGGKGRLACDFLRECEKVVPELFPRLTYISVEQSPLMKTAQERHLQEFVNKGRGVRWEISLEKLQTEEVTGVIFSNELVDALPVHRVRMVEGTLKELFVDYDGRGFVERVGDPSTPELVAYLNRYKIQLPEGYTTEIHLESVRWMREVARILGARNCLND